MMLKPAWLAFRLMLRRRFKQPLHHSLKPLLSVCGFRASRFFLHRVIMTRLYVFADEAGCFEFSRKQNASKFFILCTVSMEDCAIGAAMLELRRKLAWDGAELGDYFHATTDQQIVRDAVFSLLRRHAFHIQATIMEKSKARPHSRPRSPSSAGITISSTPLRR
jgi:hypothetical protein